MMSPRRVAQLGLGVASLVLIGSMAVLFQGATDTPAQTVAVTPTVVEPHVVPVGLSKP